jgi:hypothetical protein
LIFSVVIAVIIILVVIIILSMFFKVARVITRIAFAFAGLVIIALVISGFFVLRDFRNFTNSSADSVYYLKDKDAVAAGFIPPDSEGKFYLMGSADVANATIFLSKKDYSALRGAHYKAFIFELSSLADEKITFALGKANFTGGFAEGLLSSADPRLYLSQSASQEEIRLMSNNMQDESEIKSVFFMAYLASAMKKDALMMIKGINRGEIRVYPETPMFFAIRVLPVSLAGRLVSETLKKGNITEKQVV